jgi:cyclopropane-fatty-acyl-phospholipid synthase
MTPARRIGTVFLGRITAGTLEVAEAGETTRFGTGEDPFARIEVRDPRAWRKLLRGGRGAGEAYMEGLWTTPDLTAVFRVGALNVGKLDNLRRRIAPLRRPWRRLRAFLVRNTPQRARRDIEAHYDLGNELFSRMLDPTMMYSCASFPGPEASLEEASRAKLEMVCAKLGLGPDDHVVEIGSGWGGFAIHAAGTRGCRVTTTTISKAQHRLATERVREAGLDDLVDVRLDDYRELPGTYDKLVSLEMIEAVGWKDFGTFFSRCSELLEPDGEMLLQAITVDDRAYEVEKDGPSFIRTYVFPNGCLPSHEVIARNVSRRTDLRPLGIEDMTEHYPETLRRWRANFNAHAGELAGLGYDERFARLWNMYLQYCEAGFMERRIGVAQFHYAKPLARARTPESPTERERDGSRTENRRAGDRLRPPRRRSPAPAPASAGSGSRRVGTGARSSRPSP